MPCFARWWASLYPQVGPSWSLWVGMLPMALKRTCGWSRTGTRLMGHAAGALSLRSPGLGRPRRRKHSKIDTVASAPGCPQTTFVVKFRAEPLRQEGNTMCGPGEYRPDPSAGITAPADLPQPEI